MFPKPAVDKKFVAVNNSVLVETTPQFIVVNPDRDGSPRSLSPVSRRETGELGQERARSSESPR